MSAETNYKILEDDEGVVVDVVEDDSPTNVDDDSHVNIDQPHGEDHVDNEQNEADTKKPERNEKTVREALKEAAAKVDVLIEHADPVMRKAREQRVAGLHGTPFFQFDKTYVQRPLSFHGTLRLNKLVGQSVRRLTEGEDAISLVSSLGSIDEMARLFGRLSDEAPDLVDEFYLLVLGVPRANDEQAVVVEILHQSCDEDGRGGLSFDDAQAILDTFIAQNSKAISDFFREMTPSLTGKVAALIGKAFVRES